MLRSILATLAKRRGRAAVKRVVMAANLTPAEPDRGVSAGDRSRPAPSLSEEEIRLRAYLKWEAAGKPAGDGLQFWLQAKQELLSGP